MFFNDLNSMYSCFSGYLSFEQTARDIAGCRTGDAAGQTARTSCDLVYVAAVSAYASGLDDPSATVGIVK